MLVVWEPILPTDLGAPSANTMARISDRRATQFWDPQHLVAQELNRTARAMPERPEMHCCEDRGFFWDQAILYAPNLRWSQQAAPLLWDGPVYKVEPALVLALGKLQ